MIVTSVPGRPLAGVTAEIVGPFTVKATALDHIPPCCILAVPEDEPVFTLAVTSESLQVTTVANVLPSHTFPVPCCSPKFDPEKVTVVPAAPLVGEMLLTLGGVGVTGGVTVTTVEDETLSRVAVIVAVPAELVPITPNTPGLGMTRATEESEVVQVTLAVRS